jgi:Sulfotransferase family
VSLSTSISDITIHETPEEELWGFHLDAPAPGAVSETYALDVRGWALGRRVPVTSVELVSRDRLLWRVRTTIERPELSETYPQAQGAGSAGFFAVVNSLNLSPQFEVLIRARLEDKSRVKLATVRGQRERLDSGFEPRIAPLMVTTLGRTGSTILMKVLATHPEVVAYRPFEHEPRVATYWLGVLSSLTDPVSYRRQINPAGTIDGTWWIGTEQPLPRRLKDPGLTRWLGEVSVREIAAFCQARIEGLYETVAAEQGTATPALFAEKFRPDGIPELMWELYPRLREVVLVRDFRDMVASMFAYNAKRGREGFRRDSAATDAEYVVDQIKSSVRGLATAWEARSERAHLIRYEDLVLDPEPTVAALLRYLELDDSPASEMVATLFARGPETEWHRTTADPAASIGRWRRDLTPEARQACEQALASELQIFGYATEEAVA